MKPTIGRVVIYNTTEADREGLNLFGNASKQLPATIVAVWGQGDNPAINVKVLPDANSQELWKPSIFKGDEPGQWNWPKIEK